LENFISFFKEQIYYERSMAGKLGWSRNNNNFSKWNS